MPYGKYSAAQKRLAAVPGAPKKIEASDLKALRKKAKKRIRKGSRNANG